MLRSAGHRLLICVGIFTSTASFGCARPAANAASTTTTASQPKDRVERAIAKFDADVERRRATFHASNDASPAAVTAELAHLVAVDQFIRESTSIPFEEHFTPQEESRFWPLFDARAKAIDARSAARVGELIEKHGWFKISVFGGAADEHGWLLVQHADHDIAFQKRVLALLEPLVAAKETSPGNYAYLYDRIAAHEHRPQRYGTQGRCVGAGAWRPDPIEEPMRLDELRSSVGLPAMAEYMKSFVTACHKAD